MEEHSSPRLPRHNYDISIYAVVRVLRRYAVSIALITLLFAAGTYLYLYFKPNIYETYATVEVGKSDNGKKDILSQLSESMSLDTEIDIIKSRFVMQKALKEVNYTHHYYAVEHYRERELYKHSPILVELTRGYGIRFKLYPEDKTHFRLEAEGKDRDGKWKYEKVHAFAETVKTPRFELTVRQKEGVPLSAKEYRFKVLTPLDAVITAMHGIDVQTSQSYSNILKIVNRDNVPLRAQEVVNALARAYLQQNIEQKAEQASKMLEFIDRQLIKINENLKDAAFKLENYKKSSSTAELSTKTKLIITKMSDYESRLVDISIEERMLDTLYKQVRSGKHLETLSVAGLKLQDPTLSQLIKELQDAVIKKKILRKDYTESFPGIKKLNTEIAQLKHIITKTIKNLKQNVSERKKLIQKSLNKHEKRLKELPENERIYGRLERNFEVNQKIYSYLLEKRAETGIIKASTVSKNRIIDEALKPNVPVAPKRTKILILGTLGGLLLGIMIAFLRSFLDDRIESEEDVRDICDYPVLGVVPHIRKGAELPKVFEAPKSAVAEAFRNLRSNLQYLRTADGTHVVVITSTVGGEGKTTVGINLAGIVSMSGKRTLLVNMDMRKPTLHKRFGLQNSVGMSTLLSGNSSLEEVIQKTEHDHLDVITSGPIPPNPSELIESETMQEMLDRLKTEYDYIILDTPPIGLVTDARSLMEAATSTLYVLRVGYSKKAFLRKVDELMHMHRVKGLGLVVNDVRPERSGYGYGYSYGYYEEDESGK